MVSVLFALVLAPLPPLSFFLLPQAAMPSDISAARQAMSANERARKRSLLRDAGVMMMIVNNDLRRSYPDGRQRV